MRFRRADSQTLSKSIRLAAPPDRVWNFITAVASITEWYDAWDAVEHAAGDERLEVGTSFRLIRRGVGRDHTALCRVTAVDAPRRLRCTQYAPGRPAMCVEFRLLPDDDGTAGTLLTHTRSWIDR